MKKYLFIFVPFLLVLGINIYFRSFPIVFPQFTEQARGMVQERIRQQATQEVYVKFPQYDPLAKDRLVAARINEYHMQAKVQMRQQAADIARQMRARYQDESGQTYLMELDCWHWARYTENVVYLGHSGDEVREGRQFDTLMLAPHGFFLPWDNFLFYFSAFLYKLFSFFRFVPLFTFLFYIPLLFVTIFIAVLYFFSYRLGKHLCAVTSSLFAGLLPGFIPRSCVGWFDKDIPNLIFPVIIIWTYLISYDVSVRRRKIIALCFSSFWAGLFCFTWASWWFIFVILVGYELITLAVLKVLSWRYKKDTSLAYREHFFSLIVFFVSTVFWIILFCGFEPFVAIYVQLKEAVKLSNPVLESIWPNVYSTVGELKRTNAREIIESVWGFFIFIPAFISMIVLLVRHVLNTKENGFKRRAICVISLWFLSMFLASLQGVRFIVFLGVPLGIALGWGLYDIYQYLKQKKHWVKGIFITGILLVILGNFFVSRASVVARGTFPLMTDAWYKVLMLFEGTPKNAVINSWWDFGDWFKVVGKRKVIFDGQSQNKPQAYWMAKALLSTNEAQSLGILRMLNNGGNDAFEIIDEYLKDPLRSMLLLESIIVREPWKAREVLSDFLPSQAVEKVIILLFDTPPPAYFIVDYSMMSKISAISYLGNWDFSKIYIVQNFKKREKDQILDYLVRLGKNNEEMQRLYQEAFLISAPNLERWISRPNQFYSGVSRGAEDNGVVFFSNGFIYNQKEQKVYTSDGKIPRSFFVQDGDVLREIPCQNANMIFSLLVFKENNAYQGVLLDRELANSLFVRLFFLKGKGLKHFKTHIDAYEGDNYIGSYQIKW